MKVISVYRSCNLVEDVQDFIKGNVKRQGSNKKGGQEPLTHAVTFVLKTSMITKITQMNNNSI